ncbi:Rieske 2Fe-2S domain-containing protein [Erythrobacter tepidarius]|jgi:Rieske 2Fe-2S family protein|uniref:Rieske 2Fe-2S domain-containing protein n=1 Tax=Erythrobacter tepidarius TaxID=60454 RepID=UPI000A399C5D|nr:Rieske 2Fe-2S domain-containing protein [Erythrobacter tepidarius]
MDPTIFERDMERVFRRHWHCLAHACIPGAGDFELFRLGNEQVILTRSADGNVRALLNVCRHCRATNRMRSYVAASPRLSC